MAPTDEDDEPQGFTLEHGGQVYPSLGAPGMYLRDYLASHALRLVMQLPVYKPPQWVPEKGDWDDPELFILHARLAYAYADAMLSVRGQG